MADLRLVLCHRSIGRLRYRRYRFHCPLAHQGVGRDAAGVRTGVERRAIRPCRRCHNIGAACGPARPQAGSRRIGAGVRRRVPCRLLFHESRPAHSSSIPDGRGAWRRNAQRRHADERVLPGAAASGTHQRDVLRLSYGSSVRRVPRRLDDSALRLAQRARAGRRGASGANDGDRLRATGVGTLHGRERTARRANPRRAGPHLIRSRDRAIVRDDREVVDCRRERHWRGSLWPLHRRFGHAVAGLFHGSGDLLRADQLDAAAVQRR